MEGVEEQRMCLIVVFSFLVCFATGKSNTNRIVGGVPAVTNEFPFIVSLQHFEEHFCGGSLIAPNVDLFVLILGGINGRSLLL